MDLRNHKFITAFLYGSISLIISCSSPAASQIQLNLPDGVWDKYNMLELKLPIPDTTATYNSYLDVRITAQYSYSYLSVIVARPGYRDTLWVTLDRDRAIRSGFFLDYRFPVDTTGFLAYGSSSSWCVSHNMPQKTLNGVATIGLLIKKQRNGQR